TTAGTIGFNSPDGVGSVSLGGHVLTTTSQTFAPELINGVLGQLTAYYTVNATTGVGTIHYSYTLTDNSSGDATSASFAVVVTDTDGDPSAAGNLVISVVDDVPVARDDVGTIAAAGTQTSGNVVTGAGVGSVADTVGADGAVVTKVEFGATSVNVPATGTTTINGAYGVLTLSANGTYSYVRNAGSQGGKSDVFTYTLTDGDADSVTAKLTINIGDGTPTITLPTAGGDGTVVYEAGLPVRGAEPAGSNAAATTETTAGTIGFNSPDGVGSVSLGGHVLTT
ncbi:MAG: hypothetical protein RSE94_23665, partial [Pseudomonas sp.]